MRVLITGGMGVIGAETSRKFVKEGHRPVIFARHRDDSLIADVLDKIDFEQGDVLDMPRILQAIKKHQVTHVVHAAAFVGAVSAANPALSIQVNVMGLVNVLEAARALNGILANEVQVMLLNLSSVEEHAKAGKVRLIAAATEKRVSALPDLPTIGETVPGFETSVWFGLWGPANMPPALLAKIHADVSKALDHPETQTFFKTNSFQRVNLSPQDFGKLIQSDLKHWTGLISALGIKID